MAKRALLCFSLLLLAEELVTFRFEVELIKQLSLKDKSPNCLVSPFQVAQSLSFLYLGKDGRKDYTLAKALQIVGRGHDKIMSYFRETQQKALAQNFVIANRVFFKSDFKIPSYMKSISENISVEVENISFDNATKAGAEIKKWFSKVVAKSSKLFGKDHLNNITQMVAVQGLSVTTTWKYRFISQSKRTFLIERPEMKPLQQKVAMMYTLAKFESFNNEEVHGIFIPFSNTDIGLLILIPKQHITTLNVIQQLEKYLLLKMRKAQETHFFLPMFNIQESMDLNGILETMGIKKIFSSLNNPSSLNNNPTNESKTTHFEQLSIFSVKPNRLLLESEYASEGDQKTFEVNRPFVFVIKDQRTIYMAGRVDSIDDLNKRP
ncbi:accessory gland protein Acp76A [Drosophila bipectinata]|uniref:accessory gland protein Acp76A n=1 Tax=Drosophila bipectinata TaxID=42026 RepID=UPI001C89970D|nr:accessory gland protein Acp76A [Drosophila bipectinata]